MTQEWVVPTIQYVNATIAPPPASGYVMAANSITANPPPPTLDVALPKGWNGVWPPPETVDYMELMTYLYHRTVKLEATLAAVKADLVALASKHQMHTHSLPQGYYVPPTLPPQ